MDISYEHLRPGNTISGPTMFMLADISFYLVTLSLIGPKSLTVTTNCSINFLRKPDNKYLTSKARVLKIGKTLSVGDVLIFNEGGVHKGSKVTKNDRMVLRYLYSSSK